VIRIPTINTIIFIMIAIKSIIFTIITIHTIIVIIIKSKPINPTIAIAIIPNIAISECHNSLLLLSYQLISSKVEFQLNYQ
jgi:hypothetical protein